MDALTNVAVFLIQALFGIYTMAVMMRFMLFAFGFDFRNQFMGLLCALTNPWCVPLGKLIPRYRNIDLPILTGAILLQILKFTLLAALLSVSLPDIDALLLQAVLSLAHSALNMFFYAILGNIILSWLNPFGFYHPIIQLIYGLSEPVLRPARRFIPTISGFDLSPMLVLLLITALQMLINA